MLHDLKFSPPLADPVSLRPEHRIRGENDNAKYSVHLQDSFIDFGGYRFHGGRCE